MRVSHTSRVFKLELRLLLNLCESIGSVRCQTVFMLAVNGEWEQLLELSCDPSDYSEWSSFMDDYQVTAMMQKNPRLPTTIDKRAVALGKFRAAESSCSETNKRLASYVDGQDFPGSDVHSAIHHAREYIRHILGPLTRADLRFAESKMRFGPGATTSVSGVVTQGKKYTHRVIDATPRVADLRIFCFPPLWKQHVTDFRLRETSKVATVPKNAKTDRVICIEPDLNIYAQLGIGALLREKLRVVGLDLNTQEYNRRLSQRAAELELCTMDLSSASDTISREAVWLLLPDRWCDLLHFARVDKTELDGEVIPLEKWSSMGNGYTFELESLLFYGVLYGCCEATGCWGEFTAYGDDLIFPAELLDIVTRTLNYLGFKVNREKTFGKGRFHESCGTDWFDGKNVRPVFLRSDHHDFETICFIYANNIRRWSHRRKDGESCDSRCLPSWLICFTAVDKTKRFPIPEGFGDVGFSVDFDRARPSVHRLVSRPVDKVSPFDRVHPRGFSGYTFLYRYIGAQMTDKYLEGAYLSVLNGTSNEVTPHGEALRGRFSRATSRRGHVFTWPNLGPWL